jgi:hypothetical protein
VCLATATLPRTRSWWLPSCMPHRATGPRASGLKGLVTGGVGREATYPGPGAKAHHHRAASAACPTLQTRGCPRVSLLVHEGEEQDTGQWHHKTDCHKLVQQLDDKHDISPLCGLAHQCGLPNAGLPSLCLRPDQPGHCLKILVGARRCIRHDLAFGRSVWQSPDHAHVGQLSHWVLSQWRYRLACRRQRQSM